MSVFQALMADAAPAVVPPAWQAAAKAKLKRDQASYAAFRAVDQAEHERAHERRVTAEVDRCAEEVRLYREDIAELEPDAAAALSAARAAQDRARDGDEYARSRRVEYEHIRDGREASAEDETCALRLADDAEEIAYQRRQDAGAAAEVSRQADAALAESRDGLAAAERELERARKLAAEPAGEAPVSDVTVRTCSSFMQSDEVWDQLSDRDRWRVRRAGEPRDMMSARRFQAMLASTFGREGSMA